MGSCFLVRVRSEPTRADAAAAAVAVAAAAAAAAAVVGSPQLREKISGREKTCHRTVPSQAP